MTSSPFDADSTAMNTVHGAPTVHAVPDPPVGTAYLTAPAAIAGTAAIKKIATPKPAANLPMTSMSPSRRSRFSDAASVYPAGGSTSVAADPIRGAIADQLLFFEGHSGRFEEAADHVVVRAAQDQLGRA